MSDNPWQEEITIGFVGNPNCGKTTLFNAYTGANLKVANWPGVKPSSVVAVSRPLTRICSEASFDDWVTSSIWPLLRMACTAWPRLEKPSPPLPR